MIVARNVFQLKFGKAREALAVMKEGLAIQKRLGSDASYRLLTDLTGPHYTLILEVTVPILPPWKPHCPESLATRTFRRTIKSWCRSWSPDTARSTPSLISTEFGNNRPPHHLLRPGDVHDTSTQLVRACFTRARRALRSRLWEQCGPRRGKSHAERHGTATSHAPQRWVYRFCGRLLDGRFISTTSCASIYAVLHGAGLRC